MVQTLMFSIISGEKGLDTQHQYEQGHNKKLVFFFFQGQVSLQHRFAHIVLVVIK